MDKISYYDRRTLRRAFPGTAFVGYNAYGGGREVTFKGGIRESGYFAFPDAAAAYEFLYAARLSRTIWRMR